MRLAREGVKRHGDRKAVDARGIGPGRHEPDALLADRDLHALSGRHVLARTRHHRQSAVERDHDPVRAAPRDDARQEVRAPEKPRDECRRRPPIHLLRSPHLLHPPGLHHQDAVGQDQRFRLVMGDEDHRRPEALLQPLQLHAHLVTQERVEVRERLVEQEHARLRDERAGQRHALLLAARQLARVARAEWAEAHEVEHALDARPE